MNPRTTRRTLLGGVLAATATAAGLSNGPAWGIDYSELPDDAKGLSAYLAEQQLWIRWQNMSVTTYRAQPAQKYPFFYPLCGPVTGISLTNDSGMPYPHHRSLFLGCQPLNGGDYWSGGSFDKGQIVSRQLALGKVTQDTAEFSDACDWVRAGQPSPLHDERQFRVAIASPRIHLLDCDFRLTAMTDVEIGQAKHSLFAIKVAYDLAPIGGGTLENSAGGKGAAGTFGKAAEWCSFYSRRRGNPAVVEGIAILNHPENFDGQCLWFTRDYGHLSPSPFSFRKEPWKYAKGQVLRLRYRVVLHAGDPREAGLNAIYQQWLSETSTGGSPA